MTPQRGTVMATEAAARTLGVKEPAWPVASGLEPEQVAQLDKQLAADRGVGCPPAHNFRRAPEETQVLVGVGVAYVQRRARVQQVRQQHVSAPLLVVLDVREGRVAGLSLVVDDGAE